VNKKIFLISVVNLILLFVFGCGKKEEVRIIHEAKKKPMKTEIAASQEAPKETAASEEAVTSNPFLTPEEEEFFKGVPNRVNIDYLNLSAIFYSPLEGKAVIDGRIYKKGDIVDNKKIIEISPEEVILNDGEGGYVLKMKGVLVK